VTEITSCYSVCILVKKCW